MEAGRGELASWRTRNAVGKVLGWRQAVMITRKSWCFSSSMGRWGEGNDVLTQRQVGRRNSLLPGRGSVILFYSGLQLAHTEERIPHATEQLNRRATALSLHPRAQESQLLKPVYPRSGALQQEKPPQWEANPPQLESSPCSPQPEKKACQQQRPSAAKNK